MLLLNSGGFHLLLHSHDPPSTPPHHGPPNHPHDQRVEHQHRPINHLLHPLVIKPGLTPGIEEDVEEEEEVEEGRVGDDEDGDTAF